ncbi:MAG: peptide chain release factor N(5)-glutamine methyltransferase [Lysobacterales bacterium]
MTVRQHLKSARDKLAELSSGRLEAEVLLAHCLGSPRSLLYADPDLEVPNQRSELFQQLVERRLSGEPIAYLTGSREFWSLPLKVTPDVLIPRPETELLVELALKRIPRDGRWRIADLGTGSGAVALALASERRGCSVFGTDTSQAAIDLAGENAQRLAIENVSFTLGSWCKPLTGRFNLIISNPPYVARNDPHLSKGDCRFEPLRALSPGEDSLAALRSIAGESMGHLAPGGWLMLEHGPDQGEAVREILREREYTDIFTERDLLGYERVTGGRMNS